MRLSEKLGATMAAASRGPLPLHRRGGHRGRPARHRSRPGRRRHLRPVRRLRPRRPPPEEPPHPSPRRRRAAPAPVCAPAPPGTPTLAPLALLALALRRRRAHAAGCPPRLPRERGGVRAPRRRSHDRSATGPLPVPAPRRRGRGEGGAAGGSVQTDGSARRARGPLRRGNRRWETPRTCRRGRWRPWREADLVFAEDTRTAHRLFESHGHRPPAALLLRRQRARARPRADRPARARARTSPW